MILQRVAAYFHPIDLALANATRTLESVFPLSLTANKWNVAVSFSLGHHNRVAGLQQDIVFRFLASNHIFVIERMFYLFTFFGAQNVNFLNLCKLCKATAAG